MLSAHVAAHLDNIGTPAVPLRACGTMRDGAFNLSFSRDWCLRGAGPSGLVQCIWLAPTLMAGVTS